MLATLARLAALLLFAAACGSPPPAEDCTRRVGESSVDFECGPAPDAEWDQQAIDEAEERFEETAPGGRR